MNLQSLFANFNGTHFVDEVGAAKKNIRHERLFLQRKLGKNEIFRFYRICQLTSFFKKIFLRKNIFKSDFWKYDQFLHGANGPP